MNSWTALVVRHHFKWYNFNDALFGRLVAPLLQGVHARMYESRTICTKDLESEKPAVNRDRALNAGEPG